MREIIYQPTGVCSKEVVIRLDDNDVITDVRFTGGCSGNAQGVAKLALGRGAEEVMGLLEGIRCGFKKTSCPDQLSIALRQALLQR